MDQKIATRDRILDAAVNRIKHYGYGKTTMAEIAADCGMSPGNIYRFFEAKIDIAEAMARQHNADLGARIASIARRKEIPADKRLRDILALRMHENFQLIEDNAKILEIAEVLKRERPMYYNEDMALQRVYMGEILKDGVAAGLFNVDDYEFTAEMIQAATMKFSFPQLFTYLPMPKLERELDGVLSLILNGLYVRSKAAPAHAND